MKATRARITVEPLSQTTARWAKALRGRTAPGTAVITVASWDVIGKVLAPHRLEILARIPDLKPRSIESLARTLKRRTQEVRSDLVFLADLGLIELRAGTRKSLIPVARFTTIEVDFSSGKAA